MIKLIMLSFVIIEADSIQPIAWRDSSSTYWNKNNDEDLLEQLEDMDESSILDVLEAALADSTPALRMRSRFSQRLQPARGFTDGRYLGSSVRSYQRIRATQGRHLAGGMLIEKDAGEQRFNDFTSGYLMGRNVGGASVIVGDYIVEAGQGVVLWRGLGYRKGANIVLPVKRRARGIVPYASSDESVFLRGAAVAATMKSITATLFYSHRKLHGTVDSEGDVSSLYTSGYFRTTTEQLRRNAFAESLLGARVEYTGDSADALGVTGISSRYSRILSLSNNRFDGNRLQAVSADYSYSFGKIGLFGEWAHINSVVGGISGVHLRPIRSFDVVTAYRSYPARFFGLHNNGFGERSGTANERGFYLGASFAPIGGTRATVLYDQFTFPQPTSTTYFSGKGKEWMVQADVRVASNTDLTFRFREKVNMEKRSGMDDLGRSVRLDAETRKRHYRISLDHRLSLDVTLRTRVDYCELLLQEPYREEDGLLLFEDLSFRARQDLSVNMRLVIFRAESFASGIGEYESELPGAVTIPVLYGRGVRWYLLVQYQPTTTVRLSAKYAETIRDDVKTLGSGLDEIMTNRDNRLSMQVDLSL
jgi:hypothetical protein